MERFQKGTKLNRYTEKMPATQIISCKIAKADNGFFMRSTKRDMIRLPRKMPIRKVESITVNA
jgi:hypothetical protein